jgi:hypothetical protein
MDAGVGADPLAGVDEWHTWIAAPVLNPFYYRQRRLAQHLSKQGVACALTGDGGDFCASLSGEAFLSDCAVRFRPKLFIRELKRLRRKTGLTTAKLFGRYLLARLLPAPIVRLLLRVRGVGSPMGPLKRDYASCAKLRAYLRACGYYPPSARTHRQLEKQLLAGADDSMANERVLSSTLKLKQRYPLFDRRLLEVFHAIDSRFKVSPTNDRMLVRGAVGSLLPEIIASRQNKGWYAPDFRQGLARQGMRIGAAQASATAKFDSLFDGNSLASALRQLTSEAADQRFELGTLTDVAFPFFIGEFLRKNELDAQTRN